MRIVKTFTTVGRGLGSRVGSKVPVETFVLKDFSRHSPDDILEKRGVSPCPGWSLVSINI